MAIGTGAAVLGGSLLSGALGAMNARNANRAAERAAQPQPYERHETREPWAPARSLLEEALGMARDHYEHGLGYRPPPMLSSAGISGAPPELREIAAAMRERALNSQFIPNMQAGLTSFLQGPNPMMQAVFDRAMNYHNPMLDMLTSRGMAGPGSFDTGSGQIQSFLSDLLAGQQQLGAPPGPVPWPPTNP